MSLFSDTFSHFFFFFFFSSRRRHTRCGRDWSSDVCSSDLSVPHGPETHDRREPWSQSHRELLPRHPRDWKSSHPARHFCPPRAPHRSCRAGQTTGCNLPRNPLESSLPRLIEAPASNLIAKTWL